MELSSCMATASGINTDSKRLIRELTRGRESADLLRTILRENYGASVLGLVDDILETFDDSISIITAHSCESDDQVSDQVPAVMNSSARKSQDSGRACKKPAASIERRGCYKRKRRNSETETKETPTLFEDGHAWRKYGQKLILNAKHPRNYYRCTHKYDQKCKATKQVQKIQDDPAPLFRTTYHGYHTCKFKSHDDHQIIVDTAAQDDSSIMWSFNSTPNVKYGPVINPAIKHEEVYQVKPPPLISGHDYFDPADYFMMPPDDQLIKPFDGSDHGDDVMSSDVYSSSASTHSIDMQDILAFQDLIEI